MGLKRKKAAKKPAPKKAAAAPKVDARQTLFFRGRENPRVIYRVLAEVPPADGGGLDLSGFDGGIPDGEWSVMENVEWSSCAKPDDVRHMKREAV